MPVITRSLSKKVYGIHNYISDSYLIEKERFILDIKELLYKCALEKSKVERVKIATEIFQNINNRLKKLINNTSDWIRFIASIVIKINEFEQSNYGDISSKLLKQFRSQLLKAKKFASQLFINYKINEFDCILYPNFGKAKKIIESDNNINEITLNTRRQRNIPRVNYADMDMNEDDKGEISVCKRWFENGKVIYKWKKIPLSEANEYGDEDYRED